ncbi:uncharacterized protein LOC142345018 [Convolutriloba macropyga]|uniref:uncharacterized protein LOC142345018 n=1 Tax=Convolutriloba macropyga TaxID=536237 RepID=UPI003F51FBE2
MARLSGAVVEIVRFFTLFVVIALLVFINLQHANGGLRQLKSRINETSLTSVGLWTYCVKGDYGAIVLNRMCHFNKTFTHQVCFRSDKKLQNGGVPVVQEILLITASRWLVITSIPLFIALIFIHVVVAEPKSCSLRVIFILIGVGFVLQAIVMGFLIGAWKSSDPKYELSWPWVMSIVSLCVIALIAGLHAFMLCFSNESDEDLDGNADNSTTMKKGSQLGRNIRSIFIFLFFPYFLMQMIAHADQGALKAQSFAQNTDNKPLEYLFAPVEKIPKTASARSTKWATALMGFDYELKYTPGKQIPHADVFKRMDFDADESDNDRPENSTWTILVIDNQIARLDEDIVKTQPAVEETIS